MSLFVEIIHYLMISSSLPGFNIGFLYGIIISTLSFFMLKMIKRNEKFLATHIFSDEDKWKKIKKAFKV